MGRFLSRLHESRMLSFVPGRFDHTVGVFFVVKKSGQLRLILDTRKANTFFRRPKCAHLPTPAAWCSLEVSEGDTLFTAAGDIADAFHRMELPAHLRRFFRLPAIKCRYLARHLWPEGCGGNDYVTPEYATLPMGWSWSLYFCQHVLEGAASMAGLRAGDRIEDRTATGFVGGDRIVHAEYVDNFFVCGVDQQNVQSSFNRMKQVLEQWGFVIHEVTDARPDVEGLGLRIDGLSRRIALTSARIWKLRLAALALGKLTRPPPQKMHREGVGTLHVRYADSEGDFIDLQRSLQIYSLRQSKCLSLACH